MFSAITQDLFNWQLPVVVEDTNFSIDNGTTLSTVDNFFGLAAGSYPILIQDAALCQITGTVVVAEPPLLTATYATTPTLCNASCDGGISYNCRWWYNALLLQFR